MVTSKAIRDQGLELLLFYRWTHLPARSPPMATNNKPRCLLDENRSLTTAYRVWHGISLKRKVANQRMKLRYKHPPPPIAGRTAQAWRVAGALTNSRAWPSAACGGPYLRIEYTNYTHAMNTLMIRGILQHMEYFNTWYTSSLEIIHLMEYFIAC